MIDTNPASTFGQIRQDPRWIPRTPPCGRALENPFALITVDRPAARLTRIRLDRFCSARSGQHRLPVPHHGGDLT